MSAQLQKDEVKAWFHTVVNQFLGKNIMRYQARLLLNATGQTGAFGFQFDVKPFEGKVVMTTPYLVIKEGPSTFCILDANGVDHLPGLDDKVKVTPYARRDFTGRFGYEPKIESHGNFQTEVFVLGGHPTELPIESSDIKDRFLAEMVEQLNKLKAPDGFRNLAQILADAKATGFEMEDSASHPLQHPSIACQVASKKHCGEFRITLHRGRDTYTLTTCTDSGEVRRSIEDVHFDELGGVMVELIDDGEWQTTKVEVLKHARVRTTRRAA